MNVSGFRDAWTAALQVLIEDDLIVRVASLPGLTLLKLIAWIDRHQQNNKDAADLHRLLTTYYEANNLDRLYEEELELLERSGFDVEQAGAGLLGQDVARICSEDTAEQCNGDCSAQSISVTSWSAK